MRNASRIGIRADKVPGLGIVCTSCVYRNPPFTGQVPCALEEHVAPLMSAYFCRCYDRGAAVWGRVVFTRRFYPPREFAHETRLRDQGRFIERI